MSQAPRPKTKAEMATARRADLIRATIRSIAQNGLAESSVERITETAGVSRGLIRHYFESKSELLAEAYRSLCEELRGRLEEVSDARPQDGLSQLHALIEVIFRPPVHRSELLSAWYGFWHAARTDETIRAINREIYDWYRGCIRERIKLAAEEHNVRIDVDRAADTFVALTDGLWLELSVDASVFKPAYGEAICRDFIAQLLRR
jgi:AcrR family transcriptional regulator